MKRIYNVTFIFIALMMAFQIAAQQTPRMTFVEEATQASCPPCATLNPALQAMVNSNSDKVVFLGYQVWWPGYDPMFLDNETEVEERIGVYYEGLNAAPNIIIQGSGAPSATTALTQAVIDATNAEMSEFNINLTASIEDGVLNIDGTLDGTADASGDLRLRLIVIEHVISADDAPGGTNGETEYHNVFKKFINGPAGIDLEDTWAAGDSYTVAESFDLSTLNIYDYSQVEVIAIVQNDDNKFVHQAALIGDLAIIVQYALNTGATGVAQLAEVCVGENTVSPTVEIQNNGNDDLTSVDIEYSINGGDTQTYTWTGSISTLAKEEVTLDPYTFTAQASNEVAVTLTNPNNGTDENTADNTTSGTFGLAVEAFETLTVTINTDCYANENSWQIRNSSNQIIASATLTEAQSQSEVVETVVLPAGDCYTFEFTDSYGDGLHGGQWPACGVDGNISIADQFGTIVYAYDGSYDFGTEEGVFSAEVFTDVDEVALFDKVSISPNPTSGELNITLDESLAGSTDYQIFSLDGKVMMTGQLQDRVSTLNLSLFSNGIYLVRLVNDEKATTQRITVQK